MKQSLANEIRVQYISELFKVFENQGEDVGMIASNSFNLPVEKNGEEGWIEIVVKVTKDESDDGYYKREDYENKCKEKALKKKENEEKKKKKIERDKKLREQKKLERELQKK